MCHKRALMESNGVLLEKMTSHPNGTPHKYFDFLHMVAALDIWIPQS